MKRTAAALLTRAVAFLTPASMVRTAGGSAATRGTRAKKAVVNFIVVDE
jgi:hypothetical protein